MMTRISFDYGWTPMQIHHPHWSLTEYSTNDPPTIPRTALDNIIDRKLHWTSKTSSSCHPRPQGPDSFGVSPGVTLTKNFRVLEAPGISTLRMNPSLLSEVFSLNDPVTSEGDYMNSHVTGFGTDEDDNSQRVGGLVSMPDTNGVRYHAQHPLMQDLQ
ncbi:hypothetical protein DTO013E5_4442 [Penicillium roqueforti]|nr:hypothetical protein DTO012A1_4674 [Penicillium roqueforti]KAI2754607.1 hypothetical protein DTO013F2_1744 [Penicillium roqueforti]KAI3212237.1 hypothetical protein DTO013E5_4442 [Penicillium roqueforti]